MLTRLYNGIITRYARLTYRPGSRYPGPCLTDLEIAQLIDDTISRNKKRRLYAHLYQCNKCYVLWSESAVFVNDATGSRAGNSADTRSDSILSVPKKWRSPVIWAPAVGAAAIVLLTLWTKTVPYPENIDRVYVELASADSRRFEQLANELNAQTQTNTMAFSPAAVSQPQQAFAAGLHEGVEQLKRLHAARKPTGEPSAWNPEAVNDYYQLGRWVALAWFSIRIQPADSNLSRLEGILADIRIRLSQQAHDNRDKATALEQIGLLQSALRQADTAQGKNGKALRRALTLTIARLAP